MKAIIGKDISQAAEFLRRGKLVAIPTETVYGLAANAFDARAVLSIFEVKKRPGFDPLIVHLSNLEQIAEVATEFPVKAQKLTERFWPGPLTIVLKKRDVIPDMVTSGLDSIGLRMPSHPLTIRLLAELRFPLAAPSANPFGYISPTRAEHVADQLGDKIEYILDGGPCSVGVESTIVSFAEDTPKVLRAGGISLEQIRRAIGDVNVSAESTTAPTAPGMLSGHYAPRKPFFLGDISRMAEKFPGKRIGTLGFQENYGHEGLVLSKKGNIREAAKNLFAAMRQLDREDYEVILAEKVPETGLGAAINDRLRRAAHRDATSR